MGLISSKNETFENIDMSDINGEQYIPEDFRKKILKEFILPYYRTNIEYVINEKTAWSRVGTVFLTTSTLLIGAASILSFASSSYPNVNLNFFAGSVGMVALVLKEFASYANSVDHIKTLTMNDLLKNIGIKHAINDSSRNFKKVMQDSKIDTPTPVGNNDLENKLELILKYIASSDDTNKLMDTNGKKHNEDIENPENKIGISAYDINETNNSENIV